MASGINSSHLEQFIEKEANYFAEYCRKIAEEGKDFSIGDYITLRGSSS